MALREGTTISNGLLVRADNELIRAEKIANLLAQAAPSARAGMIQTYKNNPNISSDLLSEGLSLAKQLGISTEPPMVTQAQITDLYRQYLGREPDAGGLAFYSNPDFSLDLIRSDIANSAEAKQFGALSQGLNVSSILNSLTPSEMQNMAIARDINTSYPITRNGVTYDIQPDGTIQYTKLNTSGIGGLTGSFSSTGEPIVEPYYKADLNAPTTQEALLKAALAASTGAILGPAGAGLLSTPVAAAAGTGLTTLSSTGGDLEAALKAAALAGVGAAGTEALGGLFQGSALSNAYDTAFAAADAAQLANQGLDAAAIAQNLSTYVDPTIASALANTAANQAFTLSDATQLSNQGLSTNQIAEVLQSSGVSPSVATSVAEYVSTLSPGEAPVVSASDIVPELTFQPQTRAPDTTTSSTVSTIPVTEQVPIVSQTLPATTGVLSNLSPLTAVLPAITPSLPPLTPTVTTPVTTSTPPPEEQVQVTAPSVPVTTSTSIIPSLPVPVTPIVTTPTTTPVTDTQKVEVTETKTPDSSAVLPVFPTIPTLLPPPVLPTVPTTPPAPPTTPTATPPITMSDILKLVGLLGLGGAGTGMLGSSGTVGTGSIPPSDTMIGSTTPQFGPEYYGAVQQYYNAYMPETPRNVAGPLQQWYENKYGA